MTVGKQYVENYKKNESDTLVVPVMELAQEQQKDHYKQLIFAVEHAQKKVPCYSPCTNTCLKHPTPISMCEPLRCFEECKTRAPYFGDLYIEYQIKQEKLMPHLHRFYFIPHVQCPTPTYDQNLFFYDHKKEQIKYLWTIPDKQTCLLFLENAQKIVPEEQELLRMVIQFASGNLYKLAKQLNGEQVDSPLLQH